MQMLRQSWLPVSLFWVLAGAVVAVPSPTQASQQIRTKWVEPLGVHPIMREWRPAQRSAPLVLGDRTFVGTRRGDVWALSKHTGRPSWKVALGDGMDASLGTDGRRLFAGTVTGGVYALDPANGELQWRYWAGQEILGRPEVYKDLVLFTTANNQVVALRRSDGEWVWQYARGDDPSISIRGAAGLAVHEDSAYTGFSDGSVVRLDAATGRVVWQQRQVGEERLFDVDATPVIVDGRLYAVVFGSRLLALNVDDGRVEWSVSVSAREAPLVHAGTIYVGTLDGRLHTYDAATGSPGWSIQVGREALSTPVEYGGVLYVTDSESGLTALRVDDGEILGRYTRMVSGVLTPPVVTSEGVFVVSNLGHMYRFRHIRP